MKYHIFGDTGGHFLPLKRSLEKIGVDMITFTIPKNITIIHCGDLIHKGPHTDLIVDAVDKLIRNNPGQWKQLLGNHEFQHIPGAPAFWRCNCSVIEFDIINRWFNEKLATVAFGVDNIIPPNLEVSARPKMRPVNTSWLFTHAGVSYDWWVKTGRPDNAKETAESLNSFPVRNITAPGEMLMTPASYPDPPGPVWAVGNTEVFNSWLGVGVEPPFNQIHGHTTSFNFARGTWWGGGRYLAPFRNASKTNPELRAVITNLGGNNLLVGIDPGFNKTADLKEQPYITLEETSF